MEIKQAIQIALTESIGVVAGEKVLIVTDKKLKKIGEELYKAASEITTAELVEIPIGKRSGEEPSSEVAAKMLEYNVVLCPTIKSLTHTKAIRSFAKAGGRGATLPGVTLEAMERAIAVDYTAMQKMSNELKHILDHGKKVHIVTDAGTDITFSIKGRESISSAGQLKEKGKIGNLPTGETFIAPVEGTANGVIVIDGSILGKKVDEPIRVKVINGFAVEFDGDDLAKELEEYLSEVDDKNAFNIAELGIGTNPKAKITGNTLEDEKVLGTCHIAFGNNKGFGGKTEVPVHNDGILKKPTIKIDDKTIMKKGKLI